jgi:2-methylisocitrate lyase-like PEP mutase family enzyme
MNPQVSEFRRLHEAGCFVLPNPWDIGSARVLVGLGFKAVATTSAGFAWSLGRRDNEISVELSLSHLRAMATAVDVPVNADFEDGFARDPLGVAANVWAAVETGIAGVSIEDSTGDQAAPLYDFALAVERVKAARKAIDDSGTGVLLTGRSEGFIAGRPDLAETIRRLVAYAEAGADCLYAPGVRAMSDISAIVNAVCAKARQRAGRHRFHNRRAACGGGRAPNQRRWRARTRRVDRLSERREGDRDHRYILGAGA